MIAILLGWSDAATAKRVALVIGNGTYSSGDVDPVPTAKGDAAILARTLAQIGFDQVSVSVDSTRDEMLAGLATFAADARGADVAMIYYVGHGFFLDGDNRLLPVDARLATVEGAKSETVPMSRFVSALDNAKGVRILVLDAGRAPLPSSRRSRTTPWQSRLRVSGALASLELANALVIYSAKAGTLAPSQAQGTSKFAELLSATIAQPGLDVRQLFSRVREEVVRATSGRQEPYIYGTLSGASAYFVPPTPASSRGDAEATAWARATASDSEAAYSEYLRLFPEGRYWRQAARARAVHRARAVRAGPSGFTGRIVNVAADTPGSPSKLTTILQSAKDGDRILLAAGTHTSPGITVSKSLLISGPAAGTATLEFTGEQGFTVFTYTPYVLGKRRAPTVAPRPGARLWIERATIRCACHTVSVLEGNVTLREVQVMARPGTSPTPTGISLSGSAELSLIDSRIETPGFPLDISGGTLIAVGNQVSMTNPEDRALVNSSMAFGLQTIVGNRLQGVGLVGFFIGSGQSLFEDNDILLKGIGGRRFSLFALAAQSRPVAVERNRVKTGHRRGAQWVECTGEVCAIILESNKGLRK